MKKIKKRVRKADFSAQDIGCFIAFFAFLVGSVIFFAFDNTLIGLTYAMSKALNFEPFLLCSLGCVFLLVALAISSLTLFSPLFILLAGCALGAWVPSVWASLGMISSGDISLLHIIFEFLLTFVFSFAFVLFSQIELVFHSSVVTALRRDRNIVSGLLRLLILAALIFALVLISIWLVCFLTSNF